MRKSCRFAMAVHVLAVLAYKEGDRITSGFLAGSVNTNPVVIRRLLRVLQRAGLIETGKGAGSGSRLSRSPDGILLDQVYRAVEDDDAFALPPGKPNEACPVGQCIQEALGEVFASAESAMEREMAKTSLADVLESVRAHCSGATSLKKDLTFSNAL
jgi:Rrf2 family protein